MSKSILQMSDRDILTRVLTILETLHKSPPKTMMVYDNKALMALLNVKDRYLKKLRDNGYLSYSREGDKYWYTQADVDKFLRRFHFEDFSVSAGLPPY